MDKKHAVISLDGQWTMEGKNFTEGLTHKAYKSDYKPFDPVPAKVPGIVQAALYEAGRAEDPFFEDNPEKIKWVEDKEWWFFKEFTVPDNIVGDNFILVLEGITYRAEAWLNGVYVDRMEGMFKRWFLDVNDLIDREGTNVLTLRIRTQEMASQDFPGSHIGRRVIMSTAVVAPFSYFWNWSPHMVPIGIWKPISLKVIGDAQLEDPFVTTELEWTENDNVQSAKINTSVDIKSYTKEESKKVWVKGIIQGQDFHSIPVEFKQEVTLEPDHTQTVKLDAIVQKPELWWPNGMGEHPLYELKLTIEDESGIVQDETETEFGIRELTMIPNKDDEWIQNEVCGHTNRPWSIVGKPYPWTFVVNRKRLFVRGTNWLPVDSMFRLTEDRYKLFLDQAEDANVNMLRVWGGGIHESEYFFKHCNRKGILAWTEFWLACSSYPAMPHDLFVDCSVDMIKVLRNHPCLAMWSGGNEYNPDTPENKRLVDRLEAACNKADPTRDFHRGSPYRGDRHGGMIMLPTRTTNKYSDLLSGDTRMTLFRSEIAVMRSAPTLENIKKFIGEDKIWPIDRKAWEYHHAKIDEQERDAKEYGGTDNLHHWLMSGHLQHGQNHRHNMEYCRQNKYHTSGCMQWQLNGSWPSFHRELIDWYGDAKPAFFAYKRSMQDYLVLADMEKYVFDANELFKAKVYAVSDKYEEFGDVQIKAVIYDREMNVLYSNEQNVLLPADGSVFAYDIDWRVPEGYVKKVFFLHLEMVGKGEKLSENFYWVGTSPYSRPEESINLSGIDWKVQSGPEKDENAWKDATVPGRPYRIRQIDEAEFHLVGGLVEAPDSVHPNFAVYYQKTFTVPAEWKDITLEFFCAGLEGDDEVRINGVKIGVTKGKKNQIFQSDPYKTPNNVKCFYTIPQDSIQWGKENMIEIKMFGGNVTGISEAVFIRKASSVDQQEAIVDFDNEGVYLADIRNLPKTDLVIKPMTNSLTIEKDQVGELSISVKNPSDHLAFFSGIRTNGLEKAAGELFSDNYFSVLPGQEKTVSLKLVNDRGFVGTKRIRFDTEGWNTPSTTLDDIVDVHLK